MFSLHKISNTKKEPACLKGRFSKQLFPWKENACINMEGQELLNIIDIATEQITLFLLPIKKYVSKVNQTPRSCCSCTAVSLVAKLLKPSLFPVRGWPSPGSPLLGKGKWTMPCADCSESTCAPENALRTKNLQYKSRAPITSTLLWALF